MSTQTTVAERIAAAIPRGVSVPIPILAHHASGAEIWDADGRRYIDFAGGIAVPQRRPSPPARDCRGARLSSTPSPTPASA